MPGGEVEIEYPPATVKAHEAYKENKKAKSKEYFIMATLKLVTLEALCISKTFNGIAPINWTNDDMPELGAEIHLSNASAKWPWQDLPAAKWEINFSDIAALKKRSTTGGFNL